MSTPTSAIARTARGRTRVRSVPALWTSKRSPPRWRSQPSAIWERAELWVQRKSTRVGSVTADQRPVEASADRGAEERTDDVDPEAAGRARDRDLAPAEREG